MRLIIICLSVVWAYASTFGFAGPCTSSSTAYQATCIGICGSQVISLPVVRTGGISSTQNVLISTMDYSVPASSAVASVDYTPLNGYTIVFPAGVSTQTVNITVLTAGTHANNLFFQVALNNPTSGSTIDSSNAIAYIQILGKAGSVSFSMNNYSFSEAAGTVNIPLTRTGGTCGNVTIAYTLGSPLSTTAVLGTNFVLGSTDQTVTFVDGQTSANIFIRIIDTRVFEYYSLFFTMQLSAPTVRGTLGTYPTTYVFILDNYDAGIFVFSVDFTYCREDNGTAIVYINRTAGTSTSTVAPITLTVTTTWKCYTRDDDGDDFESKTQILNWLSGESSKSFSITVFNNPVYNPLIRTIQVSLSAVTGGAYIGTTMNSTWIYLIDDRDAGTISFRTSNYTVYENASYVTLDVIRSGEIDFSGINTYTSGLVSVDILTYTGTVVPGLQIDDPLYDWNVVQARGCTHISPCTATPAVHYTALPATTLTFQDGQSLQQVNISIIDNNFFEAPDRVFKVILQNVQGGAFIGQYLEFPSSFIPSIMAPLDPNPTGIPNFVSAIVTIKDDGDAAVLISKASLSVTEIGQTDILKVSLNSPPTSTVTLSIAIGNSQLVLSTGQIQFTSNNWNIGQTITVQSAPNNITEGIHAIPLTFTCASSDTKYNGAARTLSSGTGVVYGAKIYTSPWGIYNTGDIQRTLPWDDTLSGVLTAPLPATVNVYVLDANRAAILIQPEAIRHIVSKPDNFVATRTGGRVANIQLFLSSQPSANVDITITPTSKAITIAPTSITITPAQWATGAMVNISYNSANTNAVKNIIVMISSTSTDTFFQNKQMYFFACGYDRATLVLNQTQASYLENGPATGQADYQVQLSAEPIHWEHVGNQSTPHQVQFTAIDDITLSSYANQSAQNSVLITASNSTESTSLHSYQYVSLLRFSLQSMASKTGSQRAGLARLKLYRISGGENGGLGGLQLGAYVSSSAQTWQSSSLTTSCNTTTCIVIDNINTLSPVVRTDLVPNNLAFGSIGANRSLLAGLVDIIPQGSVNQSTNQYIGGSGWLSIDITTAWNDLSTSNQSEITIALYMLRETTFVYDNIDQISIASSKHPNPKWRPSIVVTSSGLVNVAATASANQSSLSLNASTVLETSQNDMTLINGAGWWQADCGNIYAIESVGIKILVPTPSTIQLIALLSTQLLTSGSNPSVNSSLASYKRTFTISTSVPWQSVQLSWHVYGSQGTIERGVAYRPNLDTLPEAQILTIQSITSIFYLQQVVMYQIPMAHARVSIGSHLPTPSTLSALNLFNLSGDELVTSDTSQCYSNMICRNELLFAADQWNNPKTVHVNILNDNVATGPRTGAISHEILSTEPDYNVTYNGACSISMVNCVSPLQSVLSISISDDDEAGVLFTQNSVTVIEGARFYPGALQPSQVGVWATLQLPLCSYNNITKENTSCSSVYNASGLWTACSLNGSSVFDNSSAYTIFAIPPTSVYGPLLSIRVVLPGNTVQIPLSLSLWTSNQTAINSSLWSLVQRIPVPFETTSTTITFSNSNNLMMQYNALVVEDSYDISMLPWQCASIQSIYLDGNVGINDEIRDVSTSRLSKRHQLGHPSIVSVQLSSEPLSQVVILVPQMIAGLNIFNPTNATQNAASLTYLTTGSYGYTTLGSTLPTKLYFNPSNWNIPQQIEICAIDDNVYSGNRSLTATFTTLSTDNSATFPQSSTSSTSTGIRTTALPAAYQYASTQFIISNGSVRLSTWPYHYVRSSTSPTTLSVAISLIDDDIPGITVSMSTLSAIENTTFPFNYSVVLDSEPKSIVTVEVSLLPAAASTRSNLATLISSTSLTFDSTSWYIPQLVSILPAYIASFEGNESSTLYYAPNIPKKDAALIVKHSVSSNDVDYQGISIAGNSPTTLAAINQGVNVVIYDVDTGCLSNMEYSCGNGQSCIAHTQYGNRCNCTGVYGMRDCQGVCSSASTCSFSRANFIIACDPSYSDSAACAGTFSPYNFVTTIYAVITQTTFKSADGTVFGPLSLPSIELAIYIVRAMSIIDSVSHRPAMQVTVDIFESMKNRAVVTKLQSLYTNNFLASDPLYTLKFEAVDILPPSSASDVILYAFVSVLAVGGASMGFMTLRYLRRPSLTKGMTHTMVVPQTQDTTALIDATMQVE
ncbi:hypothetical protein THRCLA_11251 [Thraustotheca clavata]|uniref:Calx-beta domain-containing protein n=1 Tax=Thraustotheca clavata TaxID=74557 RepID=A0A1V9Y8D7_9STRA|nr:hypothetical protein THRCLA_11251 [Thraustotheca clavata]